jgi:hypothetical protein
MSTKNLSTAGVTDHAIERWIARVDVSAGPREARLAIQRFVSLGRARAVPRHWMRGYVREEPGTRYVYNASHSKACAVIVDGAIVTILTKDLFEGRRRHLHAVPSPRVAPTSATARARWRWSGVVADEGEAA